jgi:V-type H+-transporting ATPase subunit a
MACCSIFCGSLYNEFFSLPFNLFGSCYKDVKVGEKWVGKRIDDCVYPWGFDPVWFNAENDLLFVDSFKMKWAVSLGVISMIGGVFLKALNCIYFRDWLTFFCEFIP